MAPNLYCSPLVGLCSGARVILCALARYFKGESKICALSKVVKREKLRDVGDLRDMEGTGLSHEGVQKLSCKPYYQRPTFVHTRIQCSYHIDEEMLQRTPVGVRWR